MSTSQVMFTSGAFASRRATELQVAWMDAAEDANEAYAAWRSTERAEQADAFAVYRAALDREEAAARALQREIRTLTSGASALA